ncbi:MAG: hypothetical protein HN482_06445 [Bdellovibrionales bacterium]|nr:hypothetical protein [Bdellovibrionales bacterium]
MVDRVFKRERGFFTFAQNSESGDYLRMAYALALSLKKSQSQNPWLTVGVSSGTDIPKRYRDVFDEVIEIPFEDLAKDDAWKLKNEWKAYLMTPYQETIKLDADMLFFSDFSCYWDLFECDIEICSNVLTYREELFTTNYYRKTFTLNQLPNTYSALTFFRQSPEGQLFFELLKDIFLNWDDFSLHLIEKEPQAVVTTDVAYSLAVKLLEKPNYLPDRAFQRFIHMKNLGQQWEANLQPEWNEYVKPHMTPNSELFIGPFKILSPLHYHCKDFLTDRMIKIYERSFGIE